MRYRLAFYAVYVYNHNWPTHRVWYPLYTNVTQSVHNKQICLYYAHPKGRRNNDVFNKTVSAVAIYLFPIRERRYAQNITEQAFYVNYY